MKVRISTRGLFDAGGLVLFVCFGGILLFITAESALVSASDTTFDEFLSSAWRFVAAMLSVAAVFGGGSWLYYRDPVLTIGSKKSDEDERVVASARVVKINSGESE